MEQLYIERWKLIWDHLDKPWVLFAHGTCVILREPEPDIARQATELIAQWPVHAASPLGDFNVVTLKDVPGWVITYPHPDILTYLAPEEVERADAPTVALGILGRTKRDKDAHERRIIFVQQQKHE